MSLEEMGDRNAATVTIPRWLLVALVDCHDAPPSRTPCEFVAEARRLLASKKTATIVTFVDEPVILEDDSPPVRG